MIKAILCEQLDHKDRALVRGWYGNNRSRSKTDVKFQYAEGRIDQNVKNKCTKRKIILITLIKTRIYSYYFRQTNYKLQIFRNNNRNRNYSSICGTFGVEILK